MRPFVPAAMVALVVLVAAVPALAGSGSSQGDRPVVGEETFEAELGLERRTRDVQGTLPVPEGATEVRVRVTWNGSEAADQSIALKLCHPSCDDGRELRKATGGSPLELALDEAPGDRLGWKARERASYDVDATGTVTFLGAPQEGSETGAAGPPRASPGGSADGEADAQGSSPLPGSTEIPGGWLPARWAGLLLTVGAAVAARLTPWIGRFLPFVSRDDARDHPVRAEIVSLVEAEPGLHVRELRRRVDAGSGQLDHHLRVLRDHGLLVEVEAEGYRCYFPPGSHDPETRQALVRLKSEGARAVIQALEDGDARSLRGLADDLELSPSTVKYHVDRFEEVGVVAKLDGDGGAGVTLTDQGRNLAAGLESDEV